jgi:hypothetical protein
MLTYLFYASIKFNNEYKFSSLNVRGLGNYTKRQQIVQWLKLKKYIIFVYNKKHIQRLIRLKHDSLNGNEKLTLAAIKVTK